MFKVTKDEVKRNLMLLRIVQNCPARCCFQGSECIWFLVGLVLLIFSVCFGESINVICMHLVLGHASKILYIA